MKKVFDEKLFAAFQKGNPEAIDLFYKCYYRRAKLRAVCLPDSDPRKEVLISGRFQKAVELRRRFKSLAHLERYLLLTVYCVSISRLREYTTEKEDLEAYAYISPKAEDAINPEEKHTEIQKRLTFHLAELPPDNRLLIELAFWGKKSNAEIARVLHLSVKAVATRKTRILQLLRVQLADVWFE